MNISAVTIPRTIASLRRIRRKVREGWISAAFVFRDSSAPTPFPVAAFLKLEAAPRERLRQFVYNIGSFNLSAGEIRDIVRREFHTTDIQFAPDDKRQSIVDSWPADVDDTPAREDWGLSPDYDGSRAFSEYLIPRIRKRYGC
ncbi:MAG: putative L-threonine dehydrogenase [Bacteroidetes bacterium]|nr:putative L-threonine dehydrogenase [Bacteroidota bacterium]